MKTITILRAAVLLAALAAAGAASARNDKLLLPVDSALRGSGLVAAPQADMPLRFGTGTAAGADALPSVNAHGVMDPSAAAGNNYGNKRDRRPDADVCQDAFRKALAELQQRGRASGGVAVVGIVGNYRGAVFDSPNAFECHVGMTRVVVDLRGQPVRALPAGTSTK